MAEPQKYHLRTNSDIYALNQVQRWFKQFTMVPKQIWMQCDLVLVEAFTNVVCHAHEKLPEDTPIDIEVTMFPEAMEIRIWDFGKPFDMQQEIERLTAEQRTSSEIADLPTGGRGLLISQKIADEIRYDRLLDQRNCFMMRKSFTKTSTNSV
ncbi:ATP-binding protein [Tumidithrix elongata RA019]|uniref:ATP-binding protein n=1 Tax=Tumidithrix elongata BACA0141 TaxID=2716417 RepID=A0AAW9Q2Z1_9CYAN|nr:ATP-binding protein [Tumidithrix elongata RA019]